MRRPEPSAVITGQGLPALGERLLMRRAEHRRAERERRAPRTLSEVDEARQGALRFGTAPAGPFLAESGDVRIPPLIELPRLLAAADRIASDTGVTSACSSGRAPRSEVPARRPPSRTRLALAKSPHVRDDVNVVLWEVVSLTFADRSGIDVPAWRLERIAGQPLLILQRFDRRGGHRVPFLSAMSVLGAAEREPRSISRCRRQRATGWTGRKRAESPPRSVSCRGATSPGASAPLDRTSTA